MIEEFDIGHEQNRKAMSPKNMTKNGLNEKLFIIQLDH